MRIEAVAALLTACLLSGSGMVAQQYNAVQGYNYAGSLGAGSNPAAIVNTPYPWDVTIAGLQVQYQTNAVRILDYSLIGSPARSKFQVIGGEFARFGCSVSNANIFNTRIAWGRKRAVAFGANIRTFSDIKTSEYSYKDTVSSIGSYVELNRQNGPFTGELRNSSILELFASYGQTIVDRAGYRLNAGVTVKINRGISGFRADVDDVDMVTINSGDQTDYLLNQGGFTYSYSSNYDRWNDQVSDKNNISEFLKATKTGFSFGIGVELLVKSGISSGMEDEEAYYDYDWKIGVSLMDMGTL
ncbi:DUF5723 family protein [Flavihumibacter petaseus]|nr:DUF5723 family protein [Flavihumibacter petaseus]